MQGGPQARAPLDPARAHPRRSPGPRMGSHSSSPARSPSGNPVPVRALVLERELRLEQAAPPPRRPPGEALLRMRVAGICDTDLQLVRGYMKYRGTLGHEFVAEVVEADEPSWLGRRVTADINASCGRCADCRRASPLAGHHCEARTVLGIAGRNGAFAEYLVVPEAQLVGLPGALPDEVAVFAEPLAAALHVLDELGPGVERVAVIGDGKLGLLIALALRGAGRAPLVVGHHREKLAIAARVGCDVALEGQLDARDGSFEAVVEASGAATGVALALRLTRPRGTVVLKTTLAGATSADLSPLVVHELRLVGSRCGDLRAAVRALEDGRVDPRPLIEARYSLAEGEAAMRHAARRGSRKILLENV